MKNVALSLLVFVGCSKGGSDGGASLPPVKIDPAAVNALVPADLKAKFEFVERTIERKSGKNGQKFTLAAPKSWQPGNEMFGELKPSDGDGWGTFTKLSVNSNCDGACTSKDWKATSDKVEFSQFTENKQFKIVKDEPGKNNRLVIADSDKTRYIAYAWWVDGASKYYACRAAVDMGFGGDGPDPRPAADAFAAACKAVRVD